MKEKGRHMSRLYAMKRLAKSSTRNTMRKITRSNRTKAKVQEDKY